MKYYIWTIGCQMNKAESLDIGSQLESLGYKCTSSVEAADLVILNTCVVRQSAEDKVRGMLGYLKGIKKVRPSMRIAVTGCFVNEGLKELEHSFPQVDHFFHPGDSRALDSWLLTFPVATRPGAPEQSINLTAAVEAYIPIIQGCDNFCSYCIVPYRRGRERSHPHDEIIEQAKKLTGQGAREIVLLGQNVNAYGNDLRDGTNLAGLLSDMNQIPGLLRIRFLTNHPMDMPQSLMHAMASLEKVCHHICLPLQSGDDCTLMAMNRHYKYSDYKRIIEQLRGEIPDIAISTDIIVGFPEESEERFMNTFKAVEELRFTAVHVAAYSVRPGTYAADKYADDVPYKIKMRRLRDIEALQTGILEETNKKMAGSRVQVLVEDNKNNKWFGRSYSDKPVFFRAEGDFTGKLLEILITSATPWSLQGNLISQ